MLDWFHLRSWRSLIFTSNAEVALLVLLIFLVTLTLPPVVLLYTTTFFFPSLDNTRIVHLQQKNLCLERWVCSSCPPPRQRALVCQVSASPKREQWEMVKTDLEE